MKTLLITVITLISINLSGCVVPVIVKNITDEVLEGKAINEEQKKSALAFVNHYIAARNADDKALIETMTITKFTSKNEVSNHTVTLIGKPTVLAEENIAVIWTSFKFSDSSNNVHCGASSFQLIKDNNEWKVVSATWSVEKIDCEYRATQSE